MDGNSYKDKAEELQQSETVDRAVPRVKYASPRPGCTSSVSNMLAKGVDYIKIAPWRTLRRERRFPLDDTEI